MATRPQPPKTGDSLAGLMPLITAVAALGLAAAAYFLLFSPLISRLVPGGSLDTSGESAQVERLTAYLERLDRSASAFERLNGDHKERVSRMVTDEPGTHDVFVQADAIASRNGLVMTSIDAILDEKSASPSGRKTVRVAANLAGGTYAQFKSFLAEMETALRVTDVQAVVFTSGSGNYSVVFRTYYLGTAGTAPTP